MTKITAPVKQPGEVTGVGGLVFTDGVADTNDPGILAYCEGAGYGVGGKAPKAAEPEPQVDSRGVHAGGPEMVGTPLRDAAVDPHPDDYQAPVNAGKADPHGPAVVAPEIHGSGVGPLSDPSSGESADSDGAAKARKTAAKKS